MAQKTVLVIDDDQVLVATLKEGLETLGFKVTAAYDGLQGVFQAHQNKPDLIVLDFQMPAGGGPGVYERLRASTDTAQVPILFLTGVTVDQVKEKVRSTPNTYFLKKPASVSQMQAVLGKILGDGAALPTAGLVPAPVPTAGPAPAAAQPPARPETRSKGKTGPLAPPPKGAAAPAKAQTIELRVSYADTDRLGITYYANYLKYFELGRTEFFRALGVSYRDLEAKRKIFLPAVEARCEYLAPCRYDDVLALRTSLSWMGPASLCFQSLLADKESGRLVARGFTRHAVLGENWKPARLPKDLSALLKSHLSQQ